jgi:hypothetical protein
MDKNITPRGNTSLAGKGAVVQARIRDVKRLIELAVRIPEIQDVNALRRLVISLPGLRPDGITSEGYLIDLDHFALAEELECPLLL